MTKKLPMRHVPCNGCRLCCLGDAVRLEADDLAMNYQTEAHPYIRGALMIAHKPNGECIYLDERGCRIHDRAPSLCRTADCRSLAIRIDFESAKKLHLSGRMDIRVWDQGHKLLEEMKRQSRKKKGR
jgi:Fe-S-cluster containining protein